MCFFETVSKKISSVFIMSPEDNLGAAQHSDRRKATYGDTHQKQTLTRGALIRVISATIVSSDVSFLYKNSDFMCLPCLVTADTFLDMSFAVRLCK